MDAYDALKSVKEDFESFTDVILKTFRKKEKSSLLEYVQSIGPQSELADNIEKEMVEFRKTRMRKVAL